MQSENDLSSGVSRRTFLKTTAAAIFVAGTGGGGCVTNGRSAADAGVLVNDVHSQLNPTYVSVIERPYTLDALQQLVHNANRTKVPITVCGGRHAGGGQQFLTSHTLLDLSDLNQVVQFDQQRGLIEVESGIRWPKLLDHLRTTQTKWTIRQKQGGADQLSLGGALASNVHGRGLASRPIVQDVESFTLLNAGGERLRCSRTENANLFRHAIGGYGLFGVMHTITLRLVPRVKLVRRVVPSTVDDAIEVLNDRTANHGAMQGDFQFSVDETSPGFMRDGLVSSYEPAPADAPISPDVPPETAEQFFHQLALGAHANKPDTWRMYEAMLREMDGKYVRWSDVWQSGDYVDGYHSRIDQAISNSGPASEVLSEIYVPRAALPAFLQTSALWLKAQRANLIYGVVRLIRRDDETVLNWARQDYACVIFNLHTQLTSAGKQHFSETFRGLLDRAVSAGGSYYLTYHRFATKGQTLACYPQLPGVLKTKLKYDPKELLQSDWYRHYRDLLLR